LRGNPIRDTQVKTECFKNSSSLERIGKKEEKSFVKDFLRFLNKERRKVPIPSFSFLEDTKHLSTFLPSFLHFCILYNSISISKTSFVSFFLKIKNSKKIIKIQNGFVALLIIFFSWLFSWQILITLAISAIAILIPNSRLDLIFFPLKL